MAPQSDGSSLKIMPQMYRSALSRFLGPGGDRILLGTVAVNSYCFHLMVSIEVLTQGEFEAVADQLCKDVKRAVRLDHSLREITIHTSPQDGIRSIVPQLGMYRDQYRKFFDKNNTSQ